MFITRLRNIRIPKPTIIQLKLKLFTIKIIIFFSTLLVYNKMNSFESEKLPFPGPYYRDFFLNYHNLFYSKLKKQTPNPDICNV